MKIRVSTTPANDQTLSLCNEDTKLPKKKAVFPDHIGNVSEAEEKSRYGFLIDNFL